MTKLLDLPFDQYQRYQLVSMLVDELRGKGEKLRILDVGGRTALLRRFLKHDRVTLVDLERSEEPGLVLGDGAALPFRDASFDLVCAFDTLEHVPVQLRANFVRECARVARRWVVLAGPYQSEQVEEAERLLQRFLKEKLGVRHRYLEEHRHHGLPERAGTEKLLASLGAEVASLGHGNVERWLALISLAMYMDHTPQLQSLAVRLHRFYNRGLFADDLAEPVYRHAVVAAFHGARLPAPKKPRAPARPPPRELVGFAQELAAFDAHRDAYQAEWSRLEGVIQGLNSDLSGHKHSLAELGARKAEAESVIAALEADLAGHKHSLEELREQKSESEEVIATLRADLAGHKQSLEELYQQKSESEEVIATLQADLAGHKALLAELEQRRSEAQQVISTLTDDLAGHKGLLRELSEKAERWEEILAEHRSVITARERELEQHAVVVAALRAGLAALETEHEKVLGLRQDEQREHQAVREELEREIAAQQAAREELLGELEARRSHVAELEALLARERAAFEAERERLVAERDRASGLWEGERRAFEGVIAERDQDLERHKGVLAVLRGLHSELEAEHTRLAGLRTREQGEFQAVRAELELQITALAAVRDELEREHATRSAQAAELEAAIARERAGFGREQERVRAEHAASREAWAGERRAFEGVITERERVIAEFKSVVRDLEADLSGHRETLAAVRREETGLRAELERERSGHADTQKQLAQARTELDETHSALRGARGEIAAAARALEDQERLIGELRAELKQRWKSLKRALGPRRPTPGE